MILIGIGWLCSGAATVGILYLAYRCVKNRWLDSVFHKASVFAVLWGVGLLMYLFFPVDASDSNRTCGCPAQEAIGAETKPLPVKEGWHNATRPLSAANRVTATFFPSRGGYETVASDNVKFDGPWPLAFEFVYYVFHFAVIVYLGLLLLSIFGRHLVDKIRRDAMRGEVWMRLFRWMGKCHRQKGPLKLREEMCVFWGDPESARLLAENLRSDEGRMGLGFAPRILFLLPGWLKYEDSARASIFRLTDRGYVLDFVDGLPSDDDKYNVIGKEFELRDEDVAGRRHFLLSENSAYNIGLANAILKKRSGANGAYATERLDLYIRVENSASSGMLKDWADAKTRLKSVGGEVNIHIFRETEVMAEDFIGRYPILKHRSPDGTESCGWLLEGVGDQGVVKTRSGKKGLDVLIVGFGNRGQELLNIMLENSQFLNAEGAAIPIRFAIVDKCDADGRCPARDIYRRRSPEVAESPKGSQFTVEFMDRAGDVAEDGFWHFGIRVSDYDRIVVCTGEDELNVQIGDIVRREFIAQGVKLERGRLFVQLQSEDLAGREADKKELQEDGIWPIEYFGMWSDIFTYHGIVDEDKYYGARLLNWRYCCPDETKLPGDCPLYKTDVNGNTEILCDTVANEWRKAKWFDRESSVASYRGMVNILALMGYGLDRGNSLHEDAGGTFGNTLTDPMSKVWNRLSQVEHLRWMAFMRTHGVRRWDLINPSIEEVDHVGKIAGKAKIKPNVRELINRHGALVDYDELPMVNMRLTEYNDTCDCGEDYFKGEGHVGQKGYRDNLQWNDMKFVKWIPVLFSKLWEKGDQKMKIVRVRS